MWSTIRYPGLILGFLCILSVNQMSDCVCTNGNDPEGQIEDQTSNNRGHCFVLDRPPAEQVRLLCIAARWYIFDSPAPPLPLYLSTCTSSRESKIFPKFFNIIHLTANFQKRKIKLPYIFLNTIHSPNILPTKVSLGRCLQATSHRIQGRFLHFKLWQKGKPS